MALEILLGNMKVGHACAALMNLAHVRENAGGVFTLATPTPSDFDAVWSDFLQQPSNGNGATAGVDYPKNS